MLRPLLVAYLRNEPSLDHLSRREDLMALASAIASKREAKAPAEATLNPGITWFGWTVPTALEIFVVFALGMAMLGIAIWEFNTGE